MSVVSLLGVKVLNNPAPFTAQYEFEITFECLEQLQKDLEWKLIYVGSATSTEHDQELDSLLVGPIPVGVNKFVFEAEPPDLKRIPSSDILGVTVVLLTCSYDGREFVRVGYYVNNEYDLPELNEKPPARPIIERVTRHVLAEKPRVTRFTIKWDTEESAPAAYPPEQPEADLLVDDEAAYGAEEEDDDELEELDGEDTEMAGAEDTSAQVEVIVLKETNEASDAGSEDLGDETDLSSDDGVDDLDEDEAEDDADEDVEMGDDGWDMVPTVDNTNQHQAMPHRPANKQGVQVH
ncbi:MAG: Histone chaperone asf1 [Peltula sp. TS41687]|nr:MAG: Histone chaperone asf1 [Peltula sp. TS41687]